MEFKKGVSPLIATVLLIAFSVALGAVVMNWGRGFVTDKTEDVDDTTDIQLKCSVDILLDIIEIGNTKQVCYDSSTQYLYVTVENIGSTNVSGLSMQVIDTQNNIATFENLTMLGSGSAIRYGLNYATANAVKYVGISPIVTTPGSSATQICTNNKLEISEPEACT